MRRIYIIVVFILLFSSCASRPEQDEIERTLIPSISGESWVYAPTEKDEDRLPTRIILTTDGIIIWQQLYGGIRQERTFGKWGDSNAFSTTSPNGVVVTYTRVNDVIRETISTTGKIKDFKRDDEWSRRFDAVPPVPKNLNEAILTLRKVIPKKNLKEIKEMKANDLVMMHFGLGLFIRNGFGLWEPESPLRKSMGDGHPDDVSGEIIRAFWKDLKENGVP